MQALVAKAQFSRCMADVATGFRLRYGFTFVCFAVIAVAAMCSPCGSCLVQVLGATASLFINAGGPVSLPRVSFLACLK